MRRCHELPEASGLGTGGITPPMVDVNEEEPETSAEIEAPVEATEFEGAPAGATEVEGELAPTEEAADSGEELPYGVDTAAQSSEEVCMWAPHLSAFE